MCSIITQCYLFITVCVSCSCNSHTKAHGGTCFLRLYFSLCAAKTNKSMLYRLVDINNLLVAKSHFKSIRTLCFLAITHTLYGLWPFGDTIKCIYCTWDHCTTCNIMFNLFCETITSIPQMFACLSRCALFTTAFIASTFLFLCVDILQNVKYFHDSWSSDHQHI